VALLAARCCFDFVMLWPCGSIQCGSALGASAQVGRSRPAGSAQRPPRFLPRGIPGPSLCLGPGDKVERRRRRAGRDPRSYAGEGLPDHCEGNLFSRLRCARRRMVLSRRGPVFLVPIAVASENFTGWLHFDPGIRPKRSLSTISRGGRSKNPDPHPFAA